MQQRVNGVDVVSRARRLASVRAKELGREDLADDVALVVSELVTNALLHGGGCTDVEVKPTENGLRVEVRDPSRSAPIPGLPSETSLTGRGLRLVSSLSARWRAETEAEGKVVWAEVTGQRSLALAERDSNDLLAMWGDDDWELPEAGERRFRVEVADVPTDLLVAAKSHVDNVVRELTLATSGQFAGQTAEVPAHLRSLEAVVHRFAGARLEIKRQAVVAARAHEERTRLTLDLPASAAAAAEAYVEALDEVDAYCRARRMLTLETPPQHRVFRRWYIEELVGQLRAAADGRPAPPPRTFERRLLAELDRIAHAERVAQRTARLYTVASALARADTPESVAEAVLNEGVAALGASGGGILVATEADPLSVPVAVGYDEGLLARLPNESRDDELAAVALRTGEPVWLEPRAQRDSRFPGLAGLEASTVALCAVPLEVQGRRLGALRFSFREARLFDEDERRFVLALAAQTAQALDRAQLHRTRIDLSRRLQRSLLPPSIPEIPGVDVHAVYHPFGDGMDVGGDFYDVWALGPGRWAVAIGDSTGTGPEAAALTAVVRHTLRALTIAASDPTEVMHALNRALLAAAPDETAERFCTVMFGLVTVADGVDVQLTSGGHPPPLIRRADGSIVPVHVGGSLLGVLPEIDVRSTTVRLDAGDTMVLVSDGVLEARRDGAFFDVDGLARVLAGDVPSASDAAVAIDRAVLAHTGGTVTDDMVAVVLRVPERS